MINLKNLDVANGNWFVEHNLIPLGINTYQGNNPNKRRIVCIPYVKNGSLVIIATSGWGKSVLVKRINNYKIELFNMGKPALIIDTQGVDHRLEQYKNDKPFPLFTSFGEQPFAMSNIDLYAPEFVRNKAYPEDKIFGVTLNDLGPKDFLSSGMSVSSKDEIIRMKMYSSKNREIMNDPEIFYEEFFKIPSSKRSVGEKSELDYPNDLINFSIKQSLERYFSVWRGYEPSIKEKPVWMSKERWTLTKIPPYFVAFDSPKYKPTFWDNYDNKKKVIVNLMDCKEQPIGMSMYGGYVLKDIYEYCNYKKRKDKDFNGASVFIEEGNLFLDPDDKYLEMGSNFYLTEVLCRGFKYNMEATVSFQSITGTNKEVAEYLTSGNNPIIVGNLTNRDRMYLGNLFPFVKDIKLRKRDDLPDDLSWGACEWIIIYGDRTYDTFVPFPSMTMYHKRGI